MRQLPIMIYVPYNIDISIATPQHAHTWLVPKVTALNSKPFLGLQRSSHAYCYTRLKVQVQMVPREKTGAC